MKKLNNKGFAISTLLYGLLSVVFLIVTLLISIMATNRKNTSTLVQKIEEELNRYSETTTEFSYTGEVQEYIVPYGKAGWYKIELWGASSNNPVNSYDTKNGSYTSGIAYLEENTHLYFYIGAQGGSGNSRSTDVRMDSGNDTLALTTRIMVASGGSSTGGYYNSTVGKKSYISGYAGVNSVNASGTPTQLTHSQTTNINFVNGIMLTGVNLGNGKAKIELVSSNNVMTPPEVKNNKLTEVRFIKDCIITSNTNSNHEHWREIQAISSNGINVAFGKKATYVNGSTTNTLNWITDGLPPAITGTKTTQNNSNQKCVTVDLGNIYSLDEIAVFHYFSSGNSYKYEELSVSKDGSTYTTLKQWQEGTNYLVKETSEGIRYSSRQVENEDSIKSGNYYIESVSSQGLVLEAQDSKIVDTPNVTLELFTGKKLQKWTIESIDGTYYKVTETENVHALQPADSGLEYGENVNAVDKYGGHTWEQWKIEKQSNGYYIFRSKSNNDFCLQKNSANNNVIINSCEVTNSNVLFRLINSEY